jgi:hypothetical protein
MSGGTITRKAMISPIQQNHKVGSTTKKIKALSIIIVLVKILRKNY